MTRSISPARLAALVEGFSEAPAYLGLAESLRLLIGDGRIPQETRLPSERDLAVAVGVSRTTVTRAYATLVESGFAEARRGSGTFSRVPGGRGRVSDRVLMPGPDGQELIDLNCAAGSAPVGLAAAFAEAAAELPAYLGGHGYFPTGLPCLQEAIAASYDARGLPTRPEQIMVTPGALSASAIIAQALVERGDRVMVESPVYPNAIETLRYAGARLVPSPLGLEAWDLDATEATLRQTRPSLAYVIADFQNPTGLVMTTSERETLARSMRRSGTVAVVDEAHQALELDGHVMPPPFAAFSSDALTIGSASKSFWGGLRLGWIRVPSQALMEQLTASRLRLDLGAPVLEQLVLTRLLGDSGALLEAHRARLREQRSALVAAMGEHLPEWTFRVPTGGLCLWCRLPAPRATEVAAEAERRGVVTAPGPIFAVDGGLDHFLRIPWTRPAEEMREAARVLGEAWEDVVARGPGAGRRTPRVIVA